MKAFTTTLSIMSLLVFTTTLEAFDLSKEPEIGVINITTIPSSSGPSRCTCVQSRLSEAKKENLEAMYEVGNCLVEKSIDQEEKKTVLKTCPFNNTLGAAWLLAAATRGHPKAQTLLGIMSLEGIGMKKNPEAAADLWAQASAKDYAPALYFLGHAYESGEGRPKNLERAKNLYLEASLKHEPRATYKLLNKAMND